MQTTGFTTIIGQYKTEFPLTYFRHAVAPPHYLTDLIRLLGQVLQLVLQVL